jgi:hypothetical protein
MDQHTSIENTEIPLAAHPPLALDLYIRQSGLSPATCWRYRKKGWLQTVVIAGRHYVTREAIAEFNRRAGRGEFAGAIPNPSAARLHKLRFSKTTASSRFRREDRH